MNLLSTNIGRFRVLGFLEGMSLLVLVFVAVPLKYCFGLPALTKILGPIHGGLFLLYIAVALLVAANQKWKFWRTTWKVLLASFVPFGNFYVDWAILRGPGRGD